MKTSDGSGRFTDGGANISTQLTDKFRIGAQAYARYIGELGKGRVELDWAYADYRFKDWFGVRGGKVKTALGLYNDTQDSEGLHTWALLPQSMYPLDLRSNTIAHTGGDVYGSIPLKKLGTLSYTGYIGARVFDTRGGYYYFSADQGIPITDASGRAAGFDVRWTTPLEGLMVGASWMDQTQERKGYYTTFLAGFGYKAWENPQRATAGYAEYTRGPWRLATEFRRNNYKLDIGTDGMPGIFQWDGSETAWFGSVAYRVNKWLELGAYNSRYYVDAPSVALSEANHIFDQTITARFDVNSHWNFKVEGHFIDGYGDIYSAHGFYGRSNPAGLNPTTNMLVLRTGFTF